MFHFRALHRAPGDPVLARAAAPSRGGSFPRGSEDVTKQLQPAAWTLLPSHFPGVREGVHGLRRPGGPSLGRPAPSPISSQRWRRTRAARGSLWGGTGRKAGSGPGEAGQGKPGRPPQPPHPGAQSPSQPLWEGVGTRAPERVPGEGRADRQRPEQRPTEGSRRARSPGGGGGPLPTQLLPLLPFFQPEARPARRPQPRCAKFANGSQVVGT